jgi:hypothetical protein
LRFTIELISSWAYLWIGLEEGAGSEPQVDQLTHGHPRLHIAGRKTIHLDVARVRQHQVACRIEHVEALRHVVERAVEQDVPAAQQLFRPAAAQAGGQAQGDDGRRHDHAEKNDAVHRLARFPGPT